MGKRAIVEGGGKGKDQSKNSKDKDNSDDA